MKRLCQILVLASLLVNCSVTPLAMDEGPDMDHVTKLEGFFTNFDTLPNEEAQKIFLNLAGTLLDIKLRLFKQFLSMRGITDADDELMVALIKIQFHFPKKTTNLESSTRSIRNIENALLIEFAQYSVSRYHLLPLFKSLIADIGYEKHLLHELSKGLTLPDLGCISIETYKDALSKTKEAGGKANKALNEL